MAFVLFFSGLAGCLTDQTKICDACCLLLLPDFNMRPGPSTFARPDCTSKPCKMGTNPGRTHRFYTGKPVVPFGFGLSCEFFPAAASTR